MVNNGYPSGVCEQFANWKMTIFKTDKSTNEMGHGFNSVCQTTRRGIHLVGPSQNLCSNILKNWKSRRYLKPPTIVIEQSPIKCWIPIFGLVLRYHFLEEKKNNLGISWLSWHIYIFASENSSHWLEPLVASTGSKPWQLPMRTIPETQF